MAEEEKPDAEENVRIVKSDDFAMVYTNNVQFETTVFDLKMVCGDIGRTRGSALRLEQHTAVSMSWLQAKLMAIFLMLNIAVHEETNGSIPIPKPVLPGFIKDEMANLPLDKILKSIIETEPPYNKPRKDAQEPGEITAKEENRKVL